MGKRYTSLVAKRQFKKISTRLASIEHKTPVEQMKTYFAIGRMLIEIVRDEGTYGPTGIQDLVARVPRLRTVVYAYRLMDLFRRTEIRALVLREANGPMADGRPLTLDHWIWILWPRPGVTETEREDEQRRELAWVRRASPSAAVLEHFVEVIEDVCSRESEAVRETAQRVIAQLEML